MVKFSKKRNSQKRKIVTRRNTKKRNTRNKKNSNSKRGGGNNGSSVPNQEDYDAFFRFLVCANKKPEILKSDFLRTNKTLRDCNQKIILVLKHFPELTREQFLKLFKFYKENTYVVVGDNMHYNDGDGDEFGFGNKVSVPEYNVTKQKINIIKEVSEFGYNNGLGFYTNNKNVYGFGDENSTQYYLANTIDKNTYTYDNKKELFRYFKRIYNGDALLLKIKS